MILQGGFPLAWQAAYRRYVPRNAVAIYGLGDLGSAQCLRIEGWGGVLIFCTMPQISHISLGNLTQSIQTHLTSKLGIRFTQFLTIENLNSYKSEANYSAR